MTLCVDWIWTLTRIKGGTMAISVTKVIAPKQLPVHPFALVRDTFFLWVSLDYLQVSAWLVGCVIGICLLFVCVGFYVALCTQKLVELKELSN